MTVPERAEAAKAAEAARKDEVARREAGVPMNV